MTHQLHEPNLQVNTHIVCYIVHTVGAHLYAQHISLDYQNYNWIFCLCIGYTHLYNDLRNRSVSEVHLSHETIAKDVLCLCKSTDAALKSPDWSRHNNFEYWYGSVLYWNSYCGGGGTAEVKGCTTAFFRHHLNKYGADGTSMTWIKNSCACFFPLCMFLFLGTGEKKRLGKSNTEGNNRHLLKFPPFKKKKKRQHAKLIHSAHSVFHASKESGYVIIEEFVISTNILDTYLLAGV